MKEPNRVNLSIVMPIAMSERGDHGRFVGVIEPTLVVRDTLYEWCKDSHVLEIDDYEREKTHTYELIHEDGEVFIYASKKITICENRAGQIVKGLVSAYSLLYNLELLPQEVRLFRYDKLIITKQEILGGADSEFHGGDYAAIIGCTGQRDFCLCKCRVITIYSDDGKIGCKVY